MYGNIKNGKDEGAKMKKAIWILLVTAFVLSGYGIIWGDWFRMAENAPIKGDLIEEEASDDETVPGGEDFSSGTVLKKAIALSKENYREPAKVSKELADLSYDQYRDIRFIRENGPWYESHRPFEIQFFHPGALFLNPVVIHEVVRGKSRQIPYDKSFFDYGKNTLSLTENPGGYSGFRLHYPLNTKTYYDELISFLGASYFRALGKGLKYGLSARGLAVDTAEQTGEEFPAFREFWVERPTRRAKEVTVHALLDSPSIVGAYTFRIRPGTNTIMDVDAILIPRKKIKKLGIAPLTSMYLFGENAKNRFDDYRPEVHDSDGLLIRNGKDEVLWRPLDNAKVLRVSSFEDENPKGFGLLQRDREMSHYWDFEAFYEQRPSVWIEPVGDWGKGVIQLVEIPSQQEIHDNVVAYWVPAAPVVPGQPVQFKYRMYWGANVPRGIGKVPVVDTFTGIGGVSGVPEVRKRKFVIHFDASGLGPRKASMNKTAKIMEEEISSGVLVADVSATTGKVMTPTMKYDPVSKRILVYFDFKPEDKVSELRVLLKKAGEPVSETWSYQWLP